MIIGHQKQWEFLKKSGELKKLSRAFLFAGQNKLGKKTIALKWISLIKGSTLRGQDPDLILISPKNKTIQISQIRELIWKLQLTSPSASFKVAIIDNAHLMTTEAQHAVLKTLEEPRGKTILILISSQPESLFSTIRSRCEIIKFYPVAKIEIENYLKKQGISEKKARLMASLSRGKPGEAIDLLLNPQKLENRQRSIKEFAQILNSPLYLRFQYIKDLIKRENLEETLDLWLYCLRNSLMSSFQKNQSNQRELKNNIQLLEKINFLLSTTNLNSRLALEILFLEL